MSFRTSEAIEQIEHYNKYMQQCYFCTNNIKEIDYKEADTLRRFLDSQSRILSKDKTGLCSKHQRKLARAIKTSRIMGLLPFVSR